MSSITRLPPMHRAMYIGTVAATLGGFAFRKPPRLAWLVLCKRWQRQLQALRESTAATAVTYNMWCCAAPYASGLRYKRRIRCGYPQCPKCHARRVAKMYKRLAHLTGPYVFYRHDAKIVSDIDIDERAVVKLISTAIAGTKTKAAKVFVPRCLGGYEWHTLSARTVNEKKELWLHSAFCGACSDNQVFSYYGMELARANQKVASTHTLAKHVGRTFAYPRSILFEDPLLVPRLMDYAHGDFSSMAYGACRKPRS